GVTHAADTLRKPHVLYRATQLGPDQLSDFVFKPLFFFLRERKVIGIGADLERAAIDELAGLRDGRPATANEQSPKPRDEAAAPHAHPNRRSAAAGHVPIRRRRAPSNKPRCRRDRGPRLRPRQRAASHWYWRG